MEKLQSNSRWHEIQQQFCSNGDATPVLSGLTELIDQIASEAYQSSVALIVPDGVALLAVGGYGRRELFPFSDVDILVLVERESQTTGLEEALAEFVRRLWDSGLRLSHSVRTITECTELHDQNIELNISLLDRRLLAGANDVYAKLERKLPAFLEKHSRTLARHLCRLARSRHGRFQDTFYHLEPDVKETPGGLRDLHLLHWLTSLRNSPAEIEGRLEAPVRFLHQLRCVLHYQAQRDQNLLSFEAQEQLTGLPFIAPREPAVFMREYFQNARMIDRETRRALDQNEKSDASLFTQFRDWRSRLSNADFTVSQDRVLLRTPAQLESDPAIVFRLFEFVARHGVPFSAETERRIEQRCVAFAAWCAGQPDLWTPLLAILSLPHAGAALRAMHNTGMLTAIFPEWQGILCLVVPDYYHRYTVDEHTLVAIESITSLPGAQDPTLRHFAGILSEIEDLALLRFALLFHDAGKGYGEGDHARRSVELARVAMQRIHMPAGGQSQVEFLIEHHLDLSAVMSTRDLHDPATARMLAEGIGTIERLKLLTILTYADISAVNPSAMTPWRLEQLWQTYCVTHQELVRELETDRIHDVPTHMQEVAAFIRGFPRRYLRTHTQDAIRAHIRLRELSRPTGAAVEIERHGGVYRATVVARDKPSLFASLAGAISSFGMDIVKAEAFANSQGLVLDTFVFTDPKRTLELNAQEIERLDQTLQRAALGKLNIEQLLKTRPTPPKAKRRIEPSVNFDSAACETATLVEIIADDRPGLLYDLAATFSAADCNIDVVLIDTEGHKAIDVFYIASDGRKLTPVLEQVLEQKLLAVC